MKPFTVAAWAEDFAGLYSFDTLAEADAFAGGWSAGANNYGAGKTTTYILPNDQEELNECPEDAKDVAEALARNEGETR